MRNAAGMLRCSASGKTRHREIGRSPDKMDGGAFSAEARTEFFEHAIGLDQNAPESIGILGIVRAMLLVAIEWNLIWDFVWQDVDLHRQFQLVQCAHDRFVEIRDAARLEFDRALSAVAFQNPQLMIDEIETNFESVGAVRNRRSR